MDIDLLSKMVKELILDNDEVTLPGVGTFVAEIVPASFSDKGYTINPPYRKLSFRQRQSEDTLLRDFYMKSNNVDQNSAEKILEDFFVEMREVLKQKKIILFPDLGRLRATRENNFFFVADEDLDIYPQGFGLEAISLKTHVETPDEVDKALSGLRSILESPVEFESEKVAEPVEAVPVTDTPAPVDDIVVPVPEPVIEEIPSEVEVVSLDPETEAFVDSLNPVVGTVETPAEISEVASEDVIEESEQVVEPAVSIVGVEEPSIVELVGSEPAPAVEPSAREEMVSEAELEVEPVEPTKDEPASQEAVTPVEAVPEPPATIEPEPVQPIAEKAAEQLATVPAETPKKKSTVRLVLSIILTVIIVCAVALLLFVLLAHVAPDFVDSLLYTPEELKIINY